MSADVIEVQGIQAYGYHGVLPEERKQGQPFVVDIRVRTDVSVAAASDDLAETVDYSTLAREAVDIVQGEPCNLVETVAERVADAMLSHKGVRSARVTVHKPQAPVGVPFTDVSVTVVRER
jgi:dihydroneopterin aldolase